MPDIRFVDDIEMLQIHLSSFVKSLSNNSSIKESKFRITYNIIYIIGSEIKYYYIILKSTKLL